MKTFGGGRTVQITIAERGGDRLLSVKGDVDLSTSPNLRSALLTTIPVAKGTVGVNLQEVVYMDSSGVATLIEGLRACHRVKLKFALIAPSKQVRNVLQLTRLDSVFEIRESW